MSPNTNSSRDKSSTYIKRDQVYNIISKNDKRRIENSLLEITITKHLSNPCPRFYTDIFKKAWIVCKDPAHKKLPKYNGIESEDLRSKKKTGDQTYEEN